MALESRDINDSAIMDATEQLQDANGKVQFKTTLPSGRAIESEFFPADLKRKAMVAWLDVVRQSMIDDAEEVRAKARRVLEEQKRGRIDAPSVIDQNGAPFVMPMVVPVMVPSTSAGQASALSASAMQTSLTQPLEFAKQALANDQSQRAVIATQMQQLMMRASQLDQSIAQWTAILSSIAPTPIASINSGVIISEQVNQAARPRRSRRVRDNAGNLVERTKAGTGDNQAD